MRHNKYAFLLHQNSSKKQLSRNAKRATLLITPLKSRPLVPIPQKLNIPPFQNPRKIPGTSLGRKIDDDGAIPHDDSRQHVVLRFSLSTTSLHLGELVVPQFFSNHTNGAGASRMIDRIGELSDEGRRVGRSQRVLRAKSDSGEGD